MANRYLVTRRSQLGVFHRGFALKIKMHPLNLCYIVEMIQVNCFLKRVPSKFGLRWRTSQVIIRDNNHLTVCLTFKTFFTLKKME